MELIDSDGRFSTEDPAGALGSGAAEQQLIISSMMLLPIDAAGIIVLDPSGDVQVSVASGEHARLLEVVQVETGAGPCLQACRTGEAVMVEDLRVATHRWPAFAERAEKYHYRSVCSLPLRLHEERVGALNLYRTEVGALSRFDLAVGQALADVAAIGILQERVRAGAELVNQQLQTALDSRVVIEQAKGILAERGAVDVNQAFTLLRAHARRTRQRLSDLARAVVEGADTTAILNPGTSVRRGIRQRQSV